MVSVRSLVITLCKYAENYIRMEKKKYYQRFIEDENINIAKKNS